MPMQLITAILLILSSLLANAPTSLAATVTMVHLPGGRFAMGCGEECPMQDAGPVHQVELDAFSVAVTPVTNRQFADFVAKTGYRTVSERPPNRSDYPNANPDLLVPGSAVFTPRDVKLTDPYAWWRFVPAASWRQPDGPDAANRARERPDDPVTQVTYDDALAYCHWLGGDLPTEAQFEYAARGGLARKKFAWGDELKPGGKWQANLWQGPFPKTDTGEDGYRGTSPVGAFPANGFGLRDMSGNVWQWCKDWYRPDTYTQHAMAKGPTRNPTGPASSLDPTEVGVPKRVQRGGSFLCSDQYCVRYYVGARGRGSPDSSASNLGFRCVRNHPQEVHP